MGYNVLIVESVSDHGVGSLCLPGAKSGLIKKRGFLPLVLFSFPVGRQHYVINTIAQVKYNIYMSPVVSPNQPKAKTIWWPSYILTSAIHTR